MASPQQVPKRLTPEQDARRRFIDDLRSGSTSTRLAAMSDLIAYFERTVNPSSLDTRLFPVLRYTRREDAIESQAQSVLDLRFFPVVRYKQRMAALSGFVPQLIERLDDPDARVRTGAVYLLGQIGAREGLPQLRRLSRGDTDQQIRILAADAVSALETRSHLGR